MRSWKNIQIIIWAIFRLCRGLGGVPCALSCADFENLFKKGTLKTTWGIGENRRTQVALQLNRADFDLWSSRVIDWQQTGLWTILIVFVSKVFSRYRTGDELALNSSQYRSYRAILRIFYYGHKAQLFQNCCLISSEDIYCTWETFEMWDAIQLDTKRCKLKCTNWTGYILQMSKFNDNNSVPILLHNHLHYKSGIYAPKFFQKTWPLVDCIVHIHKVLIQCLPQVLVAIRSMQSLQKKARDETVMWLPSTRPLP